MLRGLLILSALFTAAPSYAAWHEASTDHFVVYSDEDPAVLKSYAEKMEKFDKAMRVIRGVEDRKPGRANRVQVYFVEDYGDVVKLAGSGGVAGFYVGRAGQSFAVAPRETEKTFKRDQRLAVLLHEYTHHFLFANWPNATLPWWFSEGNADFAGTAEFPDDGSVLFGVPDALRLRDLGLLYGRPLPISRMVGKEFDELRGDAVYALYARGWLLVHYMHFEKSRKGQLAQYLDAINKGVEVGEAARTAFGDLAVLEGELEAYRKRKVMNQFSLAARAVPITPVTVRKLDAAEAAMMPVQLRVLRNSKRIAGQIASLARKQAKDYPSHVGAQTVLAEAELDAGELDAAEAAADRAIAADPKAGVAMLIRGMAAMKRAADAKNTDPAAWKTIRAWFTRANKIDPDDPRPLIQFYKSFGKAGATPTANAVNGLAYAFALAPQDSRVRMMLGRQYIADGNAAAAQRVLKPMAYNPHAGDAGRMVREILLLVEKGEKAAALARWDGADELKDENEG
jgi:tetratricopeptide (TPR) repeat protein